MNPALILVASSLLATAAAQSQDHYDMDWVNSYRQGFNFQCPHGEVLVAIRSYFSQRDGSDRLWSFECQPTPEGLGEPSDCWWDDISRAGMEWWVLCFLYVSTCSGLGSHLVRAPGSSHLTFINRRAPLV